MPALFSSLRTFIESDLDPSKVGSLGALALSTLFFLAKIHGFKALEFATNRRAVMTIAVALVMLHADAIEAYLGSPEVPRAVPIAATTLLASGLNTVQRAIDTVISLAGRSLKRRHRLVPAVRAASHKEPARRLAAACVHPCIPRAPPV
jgi:hypothetical protein